MAESSKEYSSAVNRISSRIVAVRIDTKERFWTIISVYASQAGYPKCEEDEFYLSLDVAVRSAPEGYYLATGGDLNGYVGSEKRGLERVNGGKRLGVRDEEREGVLDLALAHD